jgi:hypothetical protein
VQGLTTKRNLPLTGRAALPNRRGFLFLVQFYKEYYYWEDYLNGMYDIPKQKDIDTLVSLAIYMLTNKELFKSTCLILLDKWHISSAVNLTNKQCNRRAWLGQACCSFKFKVPETCTRIAWGMLTDNQQDEANKIAETIINHFESNYECQNTKLRI